MLNLNGSMAQRITGGLEHQESNIGLSQSSLPLLNQAPSSLLTSKQVVHTFFGTFRAKGLTWGFARENRDSFEKFFSHFGLRFCIWNKKEKKNTASHFESEIDENYMSKFQKWLPLPLSLISPAHEMLFFAVSLNRMVPPSQILFTCSIWIVHLCKR